MELTKRIARAWRDFFSTQEGIDGLQWILENRPELNEKYWQQAAGYEQFKKRIEELLSFGRARDNKEDEDEGLKQ
jgi:hypothetical protein